MCLWGRRLRLFPAEHRFGAGSIYPVFFLLYTLGYREDFIGRLLLDGVRS